MLIFYSTSKRNNIYIYIYIYMCVCVHNFFLNVTDSCKYCSVNATLRTKYSKSTTSQDFKLSKFQQKYLQKYSSTHCTGPQHFSYWSIVIYVLSIRARNLIFIFAGAKTDIDFLWQILDQAEKGLEQVWQSRRHVNVIDGKSRRFFSQMESLPITEIQFIFSFISVILSDAKKSTRQIQKYSFKFVLDALRVDLHSRWLFLHRLTVRPILFSIIIAYCILFSHMLSVRPSPLFKSRKTKQQKTMFATGVTMGQAEWIIDDTCLVTFVFAS